MVLQGFTIENGFTTDANNPDGPNGSGGGIRDQGNASLTLTDMLITNNSCTADGGGVSMENTTSIAWTLTVNASTITNNHAGDAGGGLETDGTGKVFVNAGTRISGNTSVNQGAGIWLDAIQNGNVMEGATLTVTDTVIDGNSATATGTVGGGIGNAGDGAVTITNSTISDNFSQGTGGGLADENGQGVSVTVINSTFAGNFALGTGGGIDSTALALNVSTTTFQNNGTGVSGGGIDFGGGTGSVMIANSLFLGNTAAGTGTGVGGGGISSLAGSFEASECQFTGNSTNGSGGGIFAIGTNLLVFGSTFNNNQATVNGGAISVATTSPSTVEVSTLVGNTAGTDGGGIFSTVALSVLEDTINANSTGNIGGGISMFNGSALTISNTIVFGNTTGFGAADVFCLSITDNGGNLIGVAPPGLVRGRSTMSIPTWGGCRTTAAFSPGPTTASRRSRPSPFWRTARPSARAS